ncbi:MAG: hypothetical protein II802_03605 [Clostridia bacterium]|nr:hypothetical protein [Clostridia bacterium]
MQEESKSNSLSALKKFFSNRDKRNAVIWSACVIGLAVIVLIVCLYIKSDKVGKALDIKNFNRVQIEFLQTFKSLETESSESEYEQDEVDSTAVYYGDDYYGDVYYDENGSMIQYGGEDNSNSGTESTQTITLLKDGGVYYQDGISGKFYLYTRGDKNYMLYYDDFYGIKADNGEWKEEEIEDITYPLIFDVSVISDIDKSNLKKTSKGYAQKDENSDYFYKIFGIKSKEKYKNTEIYFNFDNGKLTSIETYCIYDDTFEIEQNLNFKYEDKQIKIPEPDVKAGGEDA